MIHSFISAEILELRFLICEFTWFAEHCRRPFGQPGSPGLSFWTVLGGEAGEGEWGEKISRTLDRRRVGGLSHRPIDIKGKVEVEYRPTMRIFSGIHCT